MLSSNTWIIRTFKKKCPFQLDIAVVVREYPAVREEAQLEVLSYIWEERRGGKGMVFCETFYMRYQL
jgi:hypothetical protein